MGKDLTRKKSPNGVPGSLTIDLFGPGMTSLHKVGLAGLWMTLAALERENGGKPGLRGASGTWTRTPTSVTLKWDDQSQDFFGRLFRESFRIDKNGLVWLPALGEPMDNPQHAVVLQEALLGSFLQHGLTRKADPPAKPGGSLSFGIDGEPHVLKFRRFRWYSHQNPAFLVDSINPIAGWLLPGGAVRHSGLGQETTAIEEPPGRALALRFAPAGAIYFEIHRRGGGVRPRYALVVPDIADLEAYSGVRQLFLKHGVQQLYVAGTAEAGFRLLSELEAAHLLPDIQEAAHLLPDIQSASCRVISFGVVPWSSQQKTRVSIMVVRAGSAAALRTYSLCRQVLAPKRIRPAKGEPFWDIPQVPDLVATNLSEGRAWWQGFADSVADVERRKHVFSYEKGGLAKMVANKEAFPEGAERTFVLACQEAWRRRMGQLSEKARREGSKFGDQVAREFDKARITFSRCRNADALREAVADFWARGGSGLRPLQEGWRDILPLLGEERWREARDLALLALASYKGATKEEQDATEQQPDAAPREEEQT